MEKTSSKDREKELEISRNAAAQNRFDLSTPASKEELVPKHRFCGHCGAKLMEDAKFCHKCGRVAAKLPIPPKGGKQKRKVH